MAAVTRYWLRTGGTLRRVEASRGARPAFATARIADHSRVASGRDLGGAGLRKTRRTPRPAAGCNKPANFSAEKTVEVVRNHAGGTRQDGWCRRPEGSIRATGRFWEVDAQRSCRWRGGQVTKPQERQGPRRPVGASALVGTAARGPATVRTLRRRMHSRGQPRGCGETVRECRRRVVRHPEATPRCCPRGPRTGNGRRPRRAQGRTHRPAHRDHRGSPRCSKGFAETPTPASLGAALQAS